jgi:hypothetical protein
MFVAEACRSAQSHNRFASGAEYDKNSECERSYRLFPQMQAEVRLRRLGAIHKSARSNAWQQKRTEICIQLTRHSPPPTPLLPALTLSAGEYRVSGGELKVSRQVGLPRARRPKPKNGLHLFLAAFSKLACLFYSSCVISSTTLCLLRYFLRTATVMERK